MSPQNIDRGWRGVCEQIVRILTEIGEERDALFDRAEAAESRIQVLTEALCRIKNEMVASPEDAGPYFKAVANAALAQTPDIPPHVHIGYIESPRSETP